ncbi:hypothetical protein P9112_002527 [Eukaryota sp. TZLM1-RC]
MDVLTARQAHEHFINGRYLEALQLLQQIPNHNSDPRIAHNISVCNFFINNDASSFHNDLQNISIDSSIPLYNTAVALYHQWRFQDAINFVQPLVSSFDSLTDTLKQSLAILLVECNLALGKLDQVASSLDLLSCLFFPDDSTSVNDLSTPLPQFPIHATTLSFLHSLYRCQKVLSFPSSAPHLPALLKTVKKEIKGILARVPEDSTLGSIARLLKAHLDFRKGSLRKAIRVLHGCPWQSIPSASLVPHYTDVAAFNNLAATYLAFRKPNLAVSFASRSLAALASASKVSVKLIPNDVTITIRLNMVSLLFGLPSHNPSLNLLSLPFSTITSTHALLSSVPEAKKDPSILLSHAISCLHAAVIVPGSPLELEELIRKSPFYSEEKLSELSSIATELFSTSSKPAMTSLISGNTLPIAPLLARKVGSSKHRKLIAHSPGVFPVTFGPVYVAVEPRISLESSPVPLKRNELVAHARACALLSYQLLLRHSAVIDAAKQGDVVERQIVSTIWPLTTDLGCGCAGFAGDASDVKSDVGPEAELINRFESMLSASKLVLGYSFLAEDNPACALTFLPSTPLTHSIGDSTVQSTVVLQLLYRAEAHCRFGRGKEARTTLALAPDHISSSERVALLVQSAASYLVSGSNDDVETAFSMVQQARSMSPTSTVALVQLVYCCLRLSRFSEASALWSSKGLPYSLQ